jgi:hypothetical protein
MLYSSNICSAYHCAHTQTATSDWTNTIMLGENLEVPPHCNTTEVLNIEAETNQSTYKIIVIFSGPSMSEGSCSCHVASLVLHKGWINMATI